jgi:hypothetical protein
MTPAAKRRVLDPFAGPCCKMRDLTPPSPASGRG